MKRIINGKLYDTDTAKLLASYHNDFSPSDFEYFNEDLYIKKTGEYFLLGEGGPKSYYAEYHGNISMGSKRIIPISEDRAKEWAERNLEADEYISIFGGVEE